MHTVMHMSTVWRNEEIGVGDRETEAHIQGEGRERLRSYLLVFRHRF